MGDRNCKGRSQSMNIGVWAIRPSEKLFRASIDMMESGSFKCDEKHGVQAMTTFLMKKLYWDQGRKVYCLDLPYNCKGDTMDPCDKRPDAYGRTGKIYVLHWSGETKPWQHWWDSNKGAPKEGLKEAQKRTVL